MTVVDKEMAAAATRRMEEQIDAFDVRERVTTGYRVSSLHCRRCGKGPLSITNRSQLCGRCRSNRAERRARASQRSRNP